MISRAVRRVFFLHSDPVGAGQRAISLNIPLFDPLIEVAWP